MVETQKIKQTSRAGENVAVRYIAYQCLGNPNCMQQQTIQRCLDTPPKKKKFGKACCMWVLVAFFVGGRGRVFVFIGVMATTPYVREAFEETRLGLFVKLVHTQMCTHVRMCTHAHARTRTRATQQRTFLNPNATHKSLS